MQLSAVILAKVLAYVETFDLDPKGGVFYPALSQALVERYKFQKYPKTIEEFDETKGIEFTEGRISGKNIQKFTIFNSLLIMETRSNTDDSKKILDDLLLWAAAKFGVKYQTGSIKRYAYISDITFYSDVPMLRGAGSSPLVDLANKISEALTEIWQEPVEYRPVNVAIGHDPTARKYGIAPFSITYRAEARFSENKYFSEAPLPTDMHIKFLQELEAEIKRLQGHAVND